MRIFTSFFVCALLLLQVKICNAQTPSISFYRLPQPEGNFFGNVGGITQDPKGYIWIASTATGLFRYDGYETINYKNDPANPNSLSNNWIECIYADSSGMIWLGTWGNGLDRFDPATGIFTHFTHDPKNPSSIAQNLVTTIYEDKEGELWIGTHGGLDLMDRKTGKFKHYPHDPNDPSSLSNNQVRVIYEDKQGVLWIGTGSPWETGTTSGRPGEAGTAGEGGLNRLDRKTGKFTRYMHDDKDPHSLAQNKVRALFEDSHGNFWVGSTGEDGLQIMDRAKGTFRRYPYDALHSEKLSRPSLNKQITYDQISFITEDAIGGIWIGTAGNGMNRYDPATQTIKHYGYSDSASGFVSSSAWAHYTSRDSVLWIGSFDGDLYRVDLFHTNIPHVTLGKKTLAFFEDGKGSLWIGTDSGLIQKDIITSKTHLFTNNLFRNTTSTISDPSGNIWFSTNGQGFYRFDPGMKTFTNYHHDEKNKNSVVSNEIYCLYAGSGENIWIGTDSGFDAMNIKTGKFTHYKNNSEDSSNNDLNFVYAIYEDEQGQVWTGARSGVTKLDQKTGKIKYYPFSNGTNFIYRDNDGDLWVPVNEGLYKYDKTNDRFSPVINPATGKELGPVASMVEDDQKNLWITSIGGLIKFSKQQNTFLTYGINAGVSNVNGAAAYKDSKGQLYFSSWSGYYSFVPGKIIHNPTPPGILLSGFRISNFPVQPGKNSPLDKPLWESNEIKLKYNQNVLSLEYAVIDYNNPAQNQSMYMLENYDNEWRPGGGNGKADYFNLPPGNYVFKIKALNSSGMTAEKSVTIIISPPWWRSWWVYTILVLLCVGVIWGFINYRSRQLRRENRILEEKVTQRTTELKKQKEELQTTLEDLKSTQTQLIQSEKMASLGELTAGIAHEIQNPLNFVNNFSEINKELLTELKEELEKGNMDEIKIIADTVIENEEKINHHGNRADSIVKSMLQHSRVSTGQKELTDINALADEYFRLSYHGLRAKDKSFNAIMRTDFDEGLSPLNGGNGKINIVPQDIGRVLLNLFNNAFYAVTQKQKNADGTYQPVVSVQTKKLNGKIEIKISDNGNGIPQNIVDKIFQPFFTTKPSGEGTGLGLSLSYDIVTKEHNGTIKVETLPAGEAGNQREGTVFTIQLPS